MSIAADSPASRDMRGDMGGDIWGDQVAMYRAVSSRDRRFDGRFVLGVTTTGIYCRPSCPARTPLRRNVRFFAVPAAAVAAGFRACKRCSPDAVPGGRRWDHRADLAGRALTLVANGVVDDGGVKGLADQLAVSERHLHRTLVEEIGVGPLALARTRRAQTAKLLLEQTHLPVTEVAFASGFASIRQFNDVIRAEFGSTPTELRRRPTRPDRPSDTGTLTLRLAATQPFDGERLVRFLAGRAVAGVEHIEARQATCTYARTIVTRHGVSAVKVAPTSSGVVAQLIVPTLAALPDVVARVRMLFDLGADILAIEEVLATDRRLTRLVRARPGLRVPGSVDGFELAVRAVVGQQISVAGARTLLSRIVSIYGEAIVPKPFDSLTHAFPSAAALAESSLEGIGLTSRRITTLKALASSVQNGDIDLRPGADRQQVRAQLMQIPGIGRWTTEYIAMRALADPDAFPEADLVLKKLIEQSALQSASWKPWRAYAALHLWTNYAEETA